MTAAVMAMDRMARSMKSWMEINRTVSVIIRLGIINITVNAQRQIPGKG